MPEGLAREIFKNATVTLHGNRELPDEIMVNRSKTGNRGKNQRLLWLVEQAAFDFAFKVNRQNAPEAWVLTSGASTHWKAFSSEMHRLVIEANTRRKAQSKPTSST